MTVPKKEKFFDSDEMRFSKQGKSTSSPPQFASTLHDQFIPVDEAIPGGTLSLVAIVAVEGEYVHPNLPQCGKIAEVNEMDVAEGGGPEFDLFQRWQIAQFQLRTVVKAVGLFPDLAEADEAKLVIVGDLTNVVIEEGEAPDEQLVQLGTLRNVKGMSVRLRLLDIGKNLAIGGHLRHRRDTREALIAHDDAFQRGELAQVEADDELKTAVAHENTAEARETCEDEGGEQRVAAAAIWHGDSFHVGGETVQVGAGADDVADGGTGDGDGGGEIGVRDLHAAQRPVGKELQRTGVKRRVRIVEPGVIIHREVAKVPLALVENGAAGVVDTVAIREAVLPAAVVEAVSVLEAESVATALVVDELTAVDERGSVGSEFPSLAAAGVVVFDLVFEGADVADAAVFIVLGHDAAVELAVHRAALVVHIFPNGEDAIIQKLVTQSVLGHYRIIILCY